MSARQSRRGFVKACAALPLLGAASSFHVHLRAAEAKPPFATDNEKINQARDVALGVLKPTPKQLEHGLRLHAESLVFESYGFAPRAALDGEKFKAAVEAGASQAELTDLSEEMMMTRWATDARERKEFLDAMLAAGVTCIFQNTGEEGSDPLRLIKRLARFNYATDLARETCFKATKPDDIAAAKTEGRLCLYFTTNGVPLRQQWESVRDELRLIRIFQQLGVRMMHSWTNWPLFTVGLVQRGHSDETIRKILGENVLRVARANFAG